MRFIGIDLAITSAHKAVVADAQGHFLTPVFPVETCARELEQLLVRAREGAPHAEVQVVMEPTGMAWFPVAAYLLRQPRVVVYLVNSQQVADLRRYYRRHAKSDRIDARVLVRLPLVDRDKLHRLVLPTPEHLACQRGCKELDRLISHTTAIKNRLRAIDRFAWPGREAVFPEPFSPAARWFREHWYNPTQVLQAGAQTIRQMWRASGLDAPDLGAEVEALVTLAEQVLALYGPDDPALNFDLLQAEVSREQHRLALLEEQHHRLKLKTVRPLYRLIHPRRHLETIYGIGQDGAAVYASFIHHVQRFDSLRALRGWSGLVPYSQQSAESEAKGLRITQAGPDLVKKFAYLNADIARQWDPQLAALYYDQMVNKGKHHTQAVCACATHLLDRIFVVLRDDKPYELRDVDGTPVTAQQAQAIIAERYIVPDDIRRRNNKRARRERADQRAEKKHARESRSR